MRRHGHHRHKHHKHKRKNVKAMMKDWKLVKKLCPVFMQYTIFCLLFALFSVVIVGVIITATVHGNNNGTPVKLERGMNRISYNRSMPQLDIINNIDIDTQGGHGGHSTAETGEIHTTSNSISTSNVNTSSVSNGGNSNVNTSSVSNGGNAQGGSSTSESYIYNNETLNVGDNEYTNEVLNGQVSMDGIDWNVLTAEQKSAWLQELANNLGVSPGQIVVTNVNTNGSRTIISFQAHGLSKSLAQRGAAKLQYESEALKSALISAVNSDIHSVEQKTAGSVIFIPHGGNILKSGMSVTIASPNADYICYTINSSLPVCSIDTCLSGTKISGSMGIVNMKPGELKVIGCADINSLVRTELFTQAVEASGPILTPSDASYIDYGDTILLNTSNSKGICYSLSKTNPECMSDGSGCRSGIYISGTVGNTYPINRDIQLSVISCTDTTKKPIPDRNSLMTLASYHIAFDAGNIVYFPQTSSTLYEGMSVSLVSENAKSLCYTTTGHNPVCASNGAQCLFGQHILGSSGSTIPLNEDVTIHAIGCADSTTTPKYGSNSNIQDAMYIINSQSGNPSPSPGPPPSTLQHPINININGNTVAVGDGTVFKNCSKGAFTCPENYICDLSTSILGIQNGCVRMVDGNSNVNIDGSPIVNIYDAEKVDIQILNSTTDINVYNNIPHTLEKGIFSSIGIVGNGFYFAFEINIDGFNRTVLSKLGQFFISEDGYIEDMMGFKLKPFINIVLVQDRKYVLEIQRDGHVYTIDELGNRLFVDRLKIVYIQNPDGLDFLDTYPFYLNCEIVKCTRDNLDEKAIWYYVPTQESGEPEYVYPWDNHAGYLRASLAVGKQALYLSGSTPYQ